MKRSEEAGETLHPKVDVEKVGFAAAALGASAVDRLASGKTRSAVCMR